MQVDALRKYLIYMKELNYSGLQLDHYPFNAKRSEKPARPAATPPPQGRPRPQPKAEAPKKAKPKSPGHLLSLMDLVETASPEQENKTKAAAIQGANATEILRKLYAGFKDCEVCPLGTTRTKFVFGEGPPDSNLMFVGEGPGRDEDLSGRPFVGRAGQLLNKIIEAMGYQRDQVFIANVVKCRPPGNRTPLPDEMAACSPILRRQIEAVDPKVIVVLGSTALKFFAGSSASIMRMRGRFIEWENRVLMPTFHPAYILRNPRAKRDVWEDMKQVMARIDA